VTSQAAYLVIFKEGDKGVEEVFPRVARKFEGKPEGMN